MNIAELQKTIYDINEEKGWHTPPLIVDGEIQVSEVLAKLALVHCELSEALHEEEAGRMRLWYNDIEHDPPKPEGYVVEIADALIRVLDTCEVLGIKLDDLVECRLATPSTLIGLHRDVSNAAEALRQDNMSEFKEAFEALWFRSFRLCERYSLDLAAAIYTKIMYNKTRPFRHGGKKA